ncbi:hemerythrin domain-containing protein [Rhodococcus phenolicus]|uniref:hemerythrin domain-containing protein n=1 Tax=Rhodococcus phenolicus TaxID=263849 RepID=UPI00082FB46B|nr:hemerythrin domain-containing protein [Rhodococcus phenolicus]
MKSNTDGPADTRMMGILHDALRRDLIRTRTALTATNPPAETQRTAISDHLLWMMGFLHYHHGVEDEFLWPLIRRLDPHTGPLLDRMDADHARISPRIDILGDAASAYRDDDRAATLEAVVTALGGLEDVLLPHLRSEEDEVMPVVSRTITRRQWDDWGHEVVKDKPTMELAREVPWVVDGLDDDRCRVVADALPAPARFILLHAFAGRYRRAAAKRWGPDVDVGPRASARRRTAAVRSAPARGRSG